METAQPGSPVADTIAQLEAERQAKIADIEEAEAFAEEKGRAYDAIQAKQDRNPASVPFTQLSAADHTLEESRKRITRKRLALADIDREIAETKANEADIIRGANTLINLVNSHQVQRSQVVGAAQALEDRFQDVSLTVEQAKRTWEALNALGYDASHILDEMEPPPTLPIGLWVAMAPQEARDAMAVERQREELRGRMGLIINSADPRRFDLATQLQARLSEADRVTGALAAGGSPVDTPSPAGMPQLVLGESRTVTS